MENTLNKSIVEQAALSWFGDSGYAVASLENKVLAAIRNTLLSKPLSGRLILSGTDCSRG